MASRRTRPQDLSTGSNLEAFRHCFARFAACDGLRHTAGKLIRARAMTNALLWCVWTSPECFRVHRMDPAVSPKGEPEEHRCRPTQLAGASESDVVQFTGFNLPHALPPVSASTISGGNSSALARRHCCPGARNLEQMQERRSHLRRGGIRGCRSQKSKNEGSGVRL